MRYTHTILILITLAGACENKTYPVDEEIEAHTEALLGTEVEGVTISFMLEHDGDLDDATKIALAAATHAMLKNTRLASLKHVTLYIAHTLETWCAVLQDDPLCARISGIQTATTELDDFVIALKPLALFKDSDKLVYVYMHELTHEAEEEFEGDTNDTHADLGYWGQDGLLETAYASYQGVK